MNVCGYYQIRSDIADEMVNEEKECETYTHRYKEVGMIKVSHIIVHDKIIRLENGREIISVFLSRLCMITKFVVILLMF